MLSKFERAIIERAHLSLLAEGFIARTKTRPALRQFLMGHLEALGYRPEVLGYRRQGAGIPKQRKGKRKRGGGCENSA